MRVLFYCSATIDRPEYHLITALAGEGVGVDVAIGSDGADRRRLTDAGIHTEVIPAASRLDLSAARKLRDLMGRRTPDIVHCLGSHRQIATALIAARGRGARIVAYRGTMGHLHRWDPSSWLSYLHPRIDRIVCASYAVRDYLHGLRVPNHRLTVIYKGHACEWYDPAPRARLAEFGIPPAAFVIGCAARIAAVKGTDMLLRAARLMPLDGSIHLLLAGGVQDERIALIAPRPPLDAVVHLPGHRDDAPALMGACNVFALPSVEREGMPRAVIEAMAQAVPVVVTRVGGMPELVVHGEHGLVVPPRDPAALATALLKLKDDPVLRRRLGRAARTRISNAFSIRGTIAQTLALYNDLLAGKA